MCASHVKAILVSSTVIPRPSLGFVVRCAYHFLTLPHVLLKREMYGNFFFQQFNLRWLYFCSTAILMCSEKRKTQTLSDLENNNLFLNQPISSFASYSTKKMLEGSTLTLEWQLDCLHSNSGISLIHLASLR